MKKTALILTAFALANAFPATTYFTFTGTIAFLPTDQGGYSAAHGIHVGDPFTYVFAVDTTRDGFTKDGGVLTNKPDINTGAPPSGYTTNYFYDSLITPSLFSAAVTDSATGSFY